MSSSAPAPAPASPRVGVEALATIAILVMALLWGSTFFSIKALVTRIPVPDMLALRFTIAALVLCVVGWRSFRMSRRTLVHGVVLGVLYGAAQLFQTFGIDQTSASVSGFVTGLYVILTPLLGALLLRDRVPGLTWLAVVLATVGLGILSLNLSGGFPLGTGELLVLVSAFLYAGHIVAAGHFSTAADAMGLTVVQTIVMALVCLVAAAPDGIELPATAVDWGWLLYLAVACGSLTIFLQIWAQAHVEPTRAAVIMATEPVWAAAFAVALGGESMTWRIVLGGLAITAAMMLVIVIPSLKERRTT